MRIFALARRHPHWALLVLFDIPFLGSGTALYFLWRPGWVAWENTTAVLVGLMVVVAPLVIAFGWREGSR